MAKIFVVQSKFKQNEREQCKRGRKGAVSLRRSKRKVAVLAGIAALSVLAVVAPVVSAQTSIQEAEERQVEIEQERQSINDRIAFVSEQQVAVLRGRNEARLALDEQQSKIQAVRQSRNASSLRHSQLLSEIAAAQAEFDALQDRVAEIALHRYLQDRTDPVEILFSNADVGDGLSLVALTETLFGNTADIAAQARVVSDDLRLAQEESARLLEEMSNLDQQLTQELPLLEERRESWEVLNAQYDQISTEWRNARVQLDNEDSRLTAFIQEERAKEEIARRLAELQLTGGGGFVRPASGRVSSSYGNRLHPILGYWRLHAGIDFDGNTGDTVIAARSGIVISAAYNGGYGRTVIVQHGGGFTTLYAHLSAYSVSEGQAVQAGDKVGEVGSTGLSTGPHLHFEIRKDGVPVDPAQYL